MSFVVSIFHFQIPPLSLFLLFSLFPQFFLFLLSFFSLPALSSRATCCPLSLLGDCTTSAICHSTTQKVCICLSLFSYSLYFLCFSLLLNLFSLNIAHDKRVTNWNALQIEYYMSMHVGKIICNIQIY